MNIEKLHAIFLESTGVNTDTRSILPNQLFFALVGDVFDGNQYAVLALEKGASYAVVSDVNLSSHPNCIFVEDTLLCLQDLARLHRQYLGIPILSITGSNGKTTTKELIAQVLAAKFNVAFTKGNLNNHIGVPLTLLSFDEDVEFGIVEMGANHLKEIELLCSIALPDYGVITNIGKAHIGEFGGMENIVKAKLELFDFIFESEGIFFYNENDSVLVDHVSSYHHSNPYRLDMENYQIEILKTKPNISFEINVDNNSIKGDVDLGGLHNVENIKTAFAIGDYLGVEMGSIIHQLSLFKAPTNRSQWIYTGRNNIFLDAYNANPSSVDMAIDYFLALEEEKKLVIIGDMLELGNHELAEHTQVFDKLQSSGIEYILVGLLFSNVEGCRNIFSTKEELLKSGFLRDFDEYSILIKASRSMALESLIDHL